MKRVKRKNWGEIWFKSPKAEAELRELLLHAYEEAIKITQRKP